MRTSNKILLLIIILILFATAITGMSIGIFFFNDNPHLIKFGKGSSRITQKEYSLTDFDSINITGFWNVKIKHANLFNITVTAPEYATEYIKLDISEHTLLLKQLFFTGIPPVSPEVTISIPGLTAIKTNGSPRISFSDFNSENMVIETSGYSEIKGSHSHIHNLKIIGSGITSNDLDSCTIVNVDLALSGSGTTTLNMAGGLLSGCARGSIEIIYRGRVSEQTIDILEPAQIIKKNGSE